MWVYGCVGVCGWVGCSSLDVGLEFCAKPLLLFSLPHSLTTPRRRLSHSRSLSKTSTTHDALHTPAKHSRRLTPEGGGGEEEEKLSLADDADPCSLSALLCAHRRRTHHRTLVQTNFLVRSPTCVVAVVVVILLDSPFKELTDCTTSKKLLERVGRSCGRDRRKEGRQYLCV